MRKLWQTFARVTGAPKYLGAGTIHTAEAFSEYFLNKIDAVRADTAQAMWHTSHTANVMLETWKPVTTE